MAGVSFVRETIGFTDFAIETNEGAFKCAILLR